MRWCPSGTTFLLRKEYYNGKICQKFRPRKKVEK